MNNISESVKDKINESTYEKLEKLKDLSFMYGEVIYFNKENIEKAQEGFRYNPIEKCIIDGWTGDEYVIVGYDCSIGDGPDPIIIKTDESELPIFYFSTEYDNWKEPTKIANSLDDYIKIMNMIYEYSDDIENTNLSEENFASLMEKIKMLNNASYWNDFLEKAIIGSYDNL